MRILLVNQYYAPDIAPTGQFLSDLARQLHDRGHTVKVLCSRGGYDRRRRLPRRETRDGVTVRRTAALGFGQHVLTLKAPDYTLFYFLSLFHLATMRPRPDLVLSLTTPPFSGVIAALVARRRGLRHAHWIMDVYPDVMVAHGMLRSGTWLHRWFCRLTRYELRGSSLNIALGPDMTECLRQYEDGRAPTRCVPLWTQSHLTPWPAGEANPLRRQRGWENDVVFMYSGNMGLGHRFGEFLEVARQSGGAPGVRWVFAGSGDRRPEIVRFARQHPEARVELLPYVTVDQVRPHLCAADVHLVSHESAWTGCIMPSKLQGIFAVGRPVIYIGAQHTSLARWMRESGAGWVIEEDDIAGLRVAVDAARNAEERRRRGQAALAFAARHFDRRTNCTRICEWLEEAASRPDAS